MGWKRIVIIVLLAALCVGGALFADRQMWERDKVLTYQEEADVLQSMEDLLYAPRSGCDMDDGYLTVLDGDPWVMAMLYEETEITRLRIRFGEPVGQDTLIQVYYTGAEVPLAEENSVSKTVPEGAESVDFSLPGGIYDRLRLDINGNLWLEAVENVREVPVEPVYAPDGIRIALMAVGAVLALVLLGCVIRLIRLEEARARESGETVPRPDWKTVIRRMALAAVLVLAYTALNLFVPVLIHPEEREYFEIEEPKSLWQMVGFEAVRAVLEEDGTYYPLEGDAQLWFRGADQPVRTMRLVTGEPMNGGEMFQLYYVPAGEAISEDRSVTAFAEAGDTAVWFILPDTDIPVDYFRLDIDDALAIRDIEISEYPVIRKTEGVFSYAIREKFMPEMAQALLILGGLLTAALLAAWRWEAVSGLVRRMNGNRAYCTVRGILYCIFLAYMMLRCVIMMGHTRLTDEAFRELLPYYGFLAGREQLAAMILLVLAFVTDWRRGLFCAWVVYLFYRVSPIPFNNAVLIELVLLAGLSNLASRRQIGWAWLVSCAAYCGFLLWLNTQGWVTPLLTGKKKVFLFLPSIDRGTSLGMVHPNSPGILLMSMMLMAWWMWRPKHRWVTIAAFWLGAALVWYVSMNRTVTVIMIAFPLFDLVTDKIGKSRHPGVLYVSLITPALAIAATLFLWKMYGRWHTLFGDPAFWSRFTEVDLIKKYGVAAFGNVPAVQLSLDNFYTWLLISCGIVGTAGVLLAFTWMVIWLIRKKDFGLLGIALLFIPYSLTEHALVYPVFFFVPLLAFCGKKGGTGKLRNPGGLPGGPEGDNADNRAVRYRRRRHGDPDTAPGMPRG